MVTTTTTTTAVRADQRSRRDLDGTRQQQGPANIGEDHHVTPLEASNDEPKVDFDGGLAAAVDAEAVEETDAYRDLFGQVNLTIIRLGRAHRALAAQLMREVGLRPEQGALLMHLWSVGAVRQTALSQHLGKDSAATTRTVQRLEQAGFVRRRPDPADGRATLVEPSAAGNLLRPRVEGLWHRLERDVLELIDPDQRARTLTLLGQLADGLSAQLQHPPHPVLDDI